MQHNIEHISVLCHVLFQTVFFTIVSVKKILYFIIFFYYIIVSVFCAYISLQKNFMQEKTLQYASYMDDIKP